MNNSALLSISSSDGQLVVLSILRLLVEEREEDGEGEGEGEEKEPDS